MSWELDISRDYGKTWGTIAKRTSPEACKAVARKVHSNGVSIKTTVWYRLFCEDRLEFVSGNNTSWRMSWDKGNHKSRSEQAGVVIGASQAAA
jgi:hypothetical protein